MSVIYQLENQAHDSYRAGQYTIAEMLYGEAARLADAQSDWPTRIRMHFWHASSQRMQNKYEPSFVTYTWLIGLRNDPDVAEELLGSQTLEYIYSSYLDFVDVLRRYMPTTPVSGMHRVLDEATRFLHEIGHPEWMHGVHYQRGQLFKKENRIEEAQHVLELGLALRRNHPQSLAYTIGGHLLVIADLMRDREDNTTATQYYTEIWDGDFGRYERSRAATGLSQIATNQDAWSEAEDWARQAVSLSVELQSPYQQYHAQEALMNALLGAQKNTEALQESSRLWRLGRHYIALEQPYLTGSQLCRVRLRCTRQYLDALIPADNTAANPELATAQEQPLAFFQGIGDWFGSLFQFLGLQDAPPEQNKPAQSAKLTPEQRRQAERYLHAAERWMEYARPAAQQLDQQTQSTVRTEYIQSLVESINGLRSRIQAIG